MNKAIGILFVFFLISVWEIFTIFFHQPIYAPSASKVFGAAFSLLESESFYSTLFLTLSRCLLGFLIAAILGIFIGLLLGRSTFFSRLFGTIVEMLRPLPSSAIIPIAIVVIGINSDMNIFVIVYGCIWPILLSTMDAAKSIGEVREQNMQLMQLKLIPRFRHVVIPAIAAQVFTGIRIAASISLIIAITVEMVMGRNGLGAFLIDAQRGFEYPKLYASVAFLGLIGYLLNHGLLLLQQRIIHWKA